MFRREAMREELRLLIKLQELDQTVARLKAAKEAVVAKAAQAQQKADDEKQMLTNRVAEDRSFRMALDKRDVELKEIEGKITKLEVQLNTVRTNKEYTAIQHELLGHKADGSKIEDEILAMMEQEEKSKNEIAEFNRRVEDAAEAARRNRDACDLAIKDADARIERLAGERAQLAAEIPQDWLSPYERLRQKGDGRAMAVCSSFICESCRMSLTANTVNLLMSGDRLVFCHSCGRILYLVEGEDVHGGIGAGRKT